MLAVTFDIWHGIWLTYWSVIVHVIMARFWVMTVYEFGFQSNIPLVNPRSRLRVIRPCSWSYFELAYLSRYGELDVVLPIKLTVFESSF